MASEKRRKLFFGIFLVMENVFLIVLLGGGVLLLKTVLGGRKSRFERDLARRGLSSEDYRARAPYVMFRPRPSRSAAAYSIRMTCFRDFRGFCTTVRRGADEKTASPGSRVWELLPADARSIVEKVANGQDASKPDKSRLLARLNDLLRLPGFHTPRDFQGVELPDDARKLLALEPRALRDYEVARLNRHVLNAAFSATLKPSDVIDSRGFWSPEISRAKGPGEFRVAMVGSSVVFCAPTHELSVVAQLAKRLKQDVPGLRDRRITYINAGLPSGVSGQELAQFIHHLLPLNIDLFVAYDGFNDFYCPLNGYDLPPCFSSRIHQSTIRSSGSNAAGCGGCMPGQASNSRPKKSSIRRIEFSTTCPTWARNSATCSWTWSTTNKTRAMRWLPSAWSMPWSRKGCFLNEPESQSRPIRHSSPARSTPLGCACSFRCADAGLRDVAAGNLP